MASTSELNRTFTELVAALFAMARLAERIK